MHLRSLDAEGSWRLMRLGWRQVRRALERLLARQVVAALAGLRRGGLRGAVEPALGALLGTLHLASAIPALSVRAPWPPPTCPSEPSECKSAWRAIIFTWQTCANLEEECARQLLCACMHGAHGCPSTRMLW